jgi:hypothetical protein
LETRGLLISSLFLAKERLFGKLGHVSHLEKVSRRLGPDEKPPLESVLFYQQLKGRVGRMEWLSGDYPDMESEIPDLSGLADVFRNDER